MVYKRYLLSMLLLSMTGNVLCDGQKEKLEEEKKLLEEKSLKVEKAFKEHSELMLEIRSGIQILVDSVDDELKDGLKKDAGLFIEEVKRKLLLDEERNKKEKEWALIKVLFTQYGKCLNNKENTIEYCTNLVGFVVSQLDHDLRVVDRLDKSSALQLEQRKRMLEEELDKLNQKEESSQSN